MTLRTIFFHFWSDTLHWKTKPKDTSSTTQYKKNTSQNISYWNLLYVYAGFKDNTKH